MSEKLLAATIALLWLGFLWKEERDHHPDRWDAVHLHMRIVYSLAMTMLTLGIGAIVVTLIRYIV